MDSFKFLGTQATYILPNLKSSKPVPHLPIFLKLLSSSPHLCLIPSKFNFNLPILQLFIVIYYQRASKKCIKLDWTMPLSSCIEF